MARKTVTRREWTNEDVRLLKTLTKEGAKRSVIARKLKRTESVVSQAFRRLLASPRKPREYAF
jgi:predicted transcriptional regulator